MRARNEERGANKNGVVAGSLATASSLDGFLSTAFTARWTSRQREIVVWPLQGEQTRRSLATWVYRWRASRRSCTACIVTTA